MTLALISAAFSDPLIGGGGGVDPPGPVLPPDPTPSPTPPPPPVIGSNEGPMGVNIGSNLAKAADRDQFDNLYMFPGQKIYFNISDFWDMDTKPSGVIFPDPFAFVRIYKFDGNLPFFDEILTEPGTIVYQVPANASDGDWISLILIISDFRDEDDVYHDPPVEILRWTFQVSEGSPNLVVNLIDQTGVVPKGHSKGLYLAETTVTGTPPAGRSSWNGTIFTEELGIPVIASEKWRASYLATLLQSPSTFVAGTAGPNKFHDYHITNFPFLILDDQVQSASWTRLQTFELSPGVAPKTFLIQRRATRQFLQVNIPEVTLGRDSVGYLFDTPGELPAESSVSLDSDSEGRESIRVRVQKD